MKKYLMFAACVLVAASAAAQKNANYCGELKGRHHGPLDYRMRGQINLEIVEVAHFTPEVEAGVRGTSGYLGGDLDYTLKAIPNHARALNTIAKISLRDKVVQIPHSTYPVACYFDRAIRFAPDDGAVRAIYGSYLLSLGKLDDAEAMFVNALEMMPEDAAVHYNAGLLYFKQKKYEKARLHAKKAYDMGFPLPGLKKMLTQAGQWNEAAQ
jgi:hypothetical protein